MERRQKIERHQLYRLQYSQLFKVSTVRIFRCYELEIDFHTTWEKPTYSSKTFQNVRASIETSATVSMFFLIKIA